MSDRAALLKGIRVWLVFFVVCLVLSGVTAFPLVHELRWTEEALRSLGAPEHLPGLMEWIARVRDGLDTADATTPSCSTAPTGWPSPTSSSRSPSSAPTGTPYATSGSWSSV